MTETAAPADLRADVAGREWYHTIELGQGLHTPGWFDHRSLLGTLPLPASLAGRRCLDVGTFDGFWAFEMERRGADEVIAVDLLDPTRWDWPAGAEASTVEAIGQRMEGGRGFALASEALGSRVQRRERSVYDLDPAQDGEFDFVYMGDVTLHLRDPVAALERVRSVCRGSALVMDAVDPLLSLLYRRTPAATLDGLGRPWWWKANAAGLARMAEAAGWRVVDGPRRVYIPLGEGQQRPPLSPRRVPRGQWLETVMQRWRGEPHAAVLLEP